MSLHSSRHHFLPLDGSFPIQDTISVSVALGGGGEFFIEDSAFPFVSFVTPPFYSSGLSLMRRLTLKDYNPYSSYIDSLSSFF